MASIDFGPCKAKKFYPFMRLPSELRIEVWKTLLPESRVLEFTESESRCFYRRRYYPDKPPLTTKFEKFDLLHINQESRRFFMQLYPPCFEGILPYPIYFRPKIDTALFSDEYALQAFSDYVNHIPWLEARQAIAPIRKAAMRYSRQSEMAPYKRRGNLTYESGYVGEFKVKLRTIFERLDTVEEFSFWPDWYVHYRPMDGDWLNGLAQQLENDIDERIEMMAKEGVMEKPTGKPRIVAHPERL